MKINEQEAVAIARKFVLDEYRGSKLSIDHEEYTASLDKGGFGQSVLGLSGNYWSVTFMVKNADQAITVFDPDQVIILVDAETGEPHWLPVM